MEGTKNIPPVQAPPHNGWMDACNLCGKGAQAKDRNSNSVAGRRRISLGERDAICPGAGLNTISDRLGAAVAPWAVAEPSQMDPSTFEYRKTWHCTYCSPGLGARVALSEKKERKKRRRQRRRPSRARAKSCLTACHIWTSEVNMGNRRHLHGDRHHRHGPLPVVNIPTRVPARAATTRTGQRRE
jgi:hypothetical protein